MKTKIGMVIGIGIGTALYQAFRHSVIDMDWYRIAFVTLFAAVVILVLPSRWFEKKRVED